MAFGDIMQKAVNEAGGVFGKAGSFVVDKYKDAVAANKAAEANEDLVNAKKAANGKAVGTIATAVDNVGDAVVDTLNIATGGGLRKFTNSVSKIVDKDGLHIDYKALKQAKKDNPDKVRSVGDRTAILVDDDVKDFAGCDGYGC